MLRLLPSMSQSVPAATLAARPHSGAACALLLQPPRRTLFGLPKIQIHVHTKGSLPEDLERKIQKHKKSREAIERLRERGHLSHLHWRFNWDKARLTPNRLYFGPVAVTQYRKLDPRYWIQAIQATRAASPGAAFVKESYAPLVPYFEDSEGPFRDTLEEITEPAIKGLSYSPAAHDSFLASQCMTQLYTPTLRARLLECAAHLQHGGYELRVDVEHILGAGRIGRRSQFVLLGDRSTLASADLLAPRTVLRQVGPLLMPAELKYDVDLVPIERQQVTFNDALPKDKQGMQYLVDVDVIVAGEIRMTRVPPSLAHASALAPLPSSIPSRPVAVSASTSKRSVPVGKKKGGSKARVVRLPTPQPRVKAGQRSTADSGMQETDDNAVTELPYFRSVTLRLASQVFAPEDYQLAADPRCISWKVADIDYTVTSQMFERQHKLASLMD